MNSKHRIDIHHHVVPDVFRRALAKAGVKGSGERGLPDWSVESALEMMEHVGIQTGMASIGSPGVYFGDLEATKRLSRECNEALADLRSKYPTRFGALASLPLPDIDAALKELEYAFDVLKLDGVAGFAHVGDRYLGHRDEDELYAELNRRNAVYFVHPLRSRALGTPEMAKYSFPAGSAELVFDTTRAIFNMFYNGTPSRFPNIRFVMPHCGGTAPFLQYRMREIAEMPGVAERSTLGLDGTMKHLYYDVALSGAPVPFEGLMGVADPTHILYGSDFPYGLKAVQAAQDTADAVASLACFTDEVRRGIEHDNALRLFPRLNVQG